MAGINAGGNTPLQKPSTEFFVLLFILAVVYLAAQGKFSKAIQVLRQKTPKEVAPKGTGLFNWQKPVDIMSGGPVSPLGIQKGQGVA